MQARLVYRLLIFIVLATTIAGCAGPSQEANLLDMSEQSYESALRWQNYEVALSFHKGAFKKQTKASRDRFKKFKVTDYSVVSNVMNPDLRHALQVVRVRYFNEDYQIVHSMTLENRWEYDPKTNHWYLLNPMPAFK